MQSNETKVVIACVGCGRGMEFIVRTHRKNPISTKFCSIACRAMAQREGKMPAPNQYGQKRAWSHKEDILLSCKYPTCEDVDSLCNLLGRTKCEIWNRAKKLGITRCREVISKGYSRGGKMNRGRQRPDLAKRNKENLLCGDANPFFGKKHTVEVRKKISDFMKECQKDPEFHRKRMQTMRDRGVVKECPNVYEKKLIDILGEMFPGEYKFVGDWSFLIGRKNPDFVNVNGQKKVIEVFGEVYHDPASSPWEVSKDRTAEGRKQLFNEYGFKTLIVWCKEFSDEPKLRLRLREFHEET